MTNLWQQAARASRAALENGALQPIRTETARVDENGFEFVIRVLSSLDDKQEARRRLAQAGDRHRNPFLPPEPELLVTEVPPRHRCVLNKFCVIERHLLLITREFESQLQALNRDDFAALARCMSEGPALAFYNGGPDGGASQGHKHLQLLPLSGDLSLPFDARLTSAAPAAPAAVPALPFRHCLAAVPPGLFEQAGTAAAWLQETYAGMLADLGIGVCEGEVKQGYNLLLTERWLMLVPRTREKVGDVSVNALGFVGLLLVKRREQAEWLQRQGLKATLMDVTGTE